MPDGFISGIWRANVRVAEMSQDVRNKPIGPAP